MASPKTNSFDAVVIGGGHAGLEATRALSARGFQVALVSLDRTKLGAMSCNPAIGGVAKSHLVFEVDALGGLMGATSDRSAIQAKRLNLNKGPAVRSTRVQCDKSVYAEIMSTEVPMLPGVTVIEGEGARLLVDGNKISGCRLKDGSEIHARAVVITAGTFMRGLMFCGDLREKGGRYGDTAADLLTQDILSAGHRIKRLKTGTPARLRADSIDFSGLKKQWGDPEKRYFSWQRHPTRLPQLACYLTYTTEKTHEIIRRNFEKSPLFSGDIVGVGPRYCPSVEDKVKRFADRDRHQIFLEPEGLNTNSIYPNGLSTSLPADVQLEFLRSIPGLEAVELVRPGYAVEYDTIDPTELNRGFMSKHVEGLFFGGQVNRTSGYEEAAAQGLWAGINASLFLESKDSLVPDRSRSYLETLVDDLVTKGTEEPYRMFTSRSEYRLHLREDNAHERLFDLGAGLGLINDKQKQWFNDWFARVGEVRTKLESQKIRLSKDKVVNLFEYLKRPEVSWEAVSQELDFTGIDEAALERVEIESKYSGYLYKQESELEELKRVKALVLGDLSVIESIPSLSREIVEKVLGARPRNVYELSLISGVTPSAVLEIARVVGRKDVSRETLA